MPVKSAPDHAFVVEWALVDPPAAPERVEDQPGWLPWNDVSTRRGDDTAARRDRSRLQRSGR